MSTEEVIEVDSIVEEKEIEEEVPKVFYENIYGKSEFKNEEIKKLFESCNINFLIGSGYCFPHLKTLGDLEKLIEENSFKNKENESRKKTIESLILYDFYRNCILPHKDNIVNKVSFENSNAFVLKLYDVISKRNDKNLIKRVNLFTTNYDMFFELSLEKNRIYYNDGFGGRLNPVFSIQNYNRIMKQIVQNTERESQIPTVNLFKLHGSLAWKEKDGVILYNINLEETLDSIENSGDIFTKPEFNYDKNQDTNMSETVKKIEEENNDFEANIVKDAESFIDNYKTLHIVNPTKKKFEQTLFSNIYYDLLRMYSNELEKNNSVLFVFGFSFKDEHILNITKRALMNPSMIMYIFIYDVKEVKEFKEMFKEHPNVNFVYYQQGNKNINLDEFTNLLFGGF